MSPVEAVAAVLAVRDEQAAMTPWTPSMAAIEAEVTAALPDAPEITGPLITALRAIKDAVPDLHVKATAYPRDLFIQLPRHVNKRSHE